MAQLLVNLAALPILLRHVGAEVFGAWTAIASLLAVGSLADAGVRTEITRRVSAALGRGDPDELRRSLRTGVGILAVAACVLLVVGSLLVPAMRLFAFPGGVRGYTADDLETVLRITILLLAVSVVLDGHLAVLRGVQRSDVESISMLAGLVPGMAVAVGAAIGGLGLWALFLGALVQALTRWAIQLAVVRHLVPGLGFGVAWPGAAAVRTYIGLSALVLLTQVSDVVDSQWDRVVLAHFVGAASVASFSIGTALVLQAKTVVVLPLMPMLAAVSELRGRDAAALESTYSLLSRMTSALSITVLTGLFVLGPSFVGLWLGPEFDRAGTAIRLFSIAVAVNLTCAAAAIRAVGTGWHAIAAASAFTNIVVNAALSVVLASMIGYNGPLIGSIAGNVAAVAVLQTLLWRRTRERWTVPRWPAPAAGVAIAVVAVGTGLDRQTTWAALVAATIVLGATLAVATGIAERLPVRSLLRVDHRGGA